MIKVDVIGIDGQAESRFLAPGAALEAFELMREALRLTITYPEMPALVGKRVRAALALADKIGTWHIPPDAVKVKP